MSEADCRKSQDRKCESFGMHESPQQGASAPLLPMLIGWPATSLLHTNVTRPWAPLLQLPCRTMLTTAPPSTRSRSTATTSATRAPTRCKAWPASWANPASQHLPPLRLPIKKNGYIRYAALGRAVWVGKRFPVLAVPSAARGCIGCNCSFMPQLGPCKQPNQHLLLKASS